MICHRIPIPSATLSCNALRTTGPKSMTTLSLRLVNRQRYPLSTQCSSLSTIVRPRTASITPKCRLITRQTRLSSTAAAAPGAAEPAPSAVLEPLTWNRFLQLRKIRRRINVIASVIGMASCVAGSMYLITIHEVETLASQVIGLDPLITMGLIVVATAASGWLIGPFFGNAIFNLRYRSLRVPIMEVCNLLG